MKFVVTLPNGEIATRNAKHMMDRVVAVRWTPATFASQASIVLPTYAKIYQEKADAGEYGEWMAYEWCMVGRNPAKMNKAVRNLFEIVILTPQQIN